MPRPLKFKTEQDFKRFVRKVAPSEQKGVATAFPGEKGNLPLLEKRLEKIETKLRECETRIDNIWLKVRAL